MSPAESPPRLLIRRQRPTSLEPTTALSAEPSHDVLVVAACRVGLPAVLEVVGQHRVPAGLLVLLVLRLRERQRAVALELLQRRVVEGHQVLLAAGQQLLLFVGVVLGLRRQRRDVSVAEWPRQSSPRVTPNRLARTNTTPRGQMKSVSAFFFTFTRSAASGHGLRRGRACRHGAKWLTCHQGQASIMLL